ncbi:heparan-alpha-glucosaminide N-acetyltransferase domain-containing protein [Micrococcus sp. M4NT]|uniref:heparan-alpha-glucosaminide N-acetyltransferase domain-containing protein n=1 Tax=Micrococcus sp. M4NT TaxID=2957501 RepID=UPI0029A5234E|nr:heparan-alpha-glucosaminide N-acetyltransferase domain-containing protein [Micrococcus sp. M4NT]MDX2340832.1 heparan-alpha-glucosaminide N-acetyltransferase domain-containing protein [Micrococcus sp. M4NT]
MTHPAPPARLAGVDAARGVALLGMVAVHVTAPLDADGEPSLAHLLFGGLASVLFVTLAGVGLALMTGGAAGADPARLPLLRRRIARRAGLLFALGLACAWLGTPVAVILCHDGLLFLLALPFLGLRARALALPAGVGLIGGPVLVFALSAAGQALLGQEEFLMDARLWVTPSPEHLLTPGLLLTDLLLTGYYPVLSWIGFLLLGLWLGRLELERPRVAAALLAGGAVAGAAATAAGSWQHHDPAQLQRIAAGTGVSLAELPTALATGDHRLAWLVPDPLWLAVVAPHSGSVLEAVRAAGWAAAVLGLCLLAARASGLRPALAPLAGAGRVTLSLYVGHLVLIAALGAAGLPSEGGAVVAAFWILCLGAGFAALRTGRRGPLEAGVAELSRAGE